MQKAVIGGLVALMLGPATILLSLTAILNPAAEASCLPLTSINFFGKNDNATPAPVGESSRVVFPLPAGTWVKTSNYGMRSEEHTSEPQSLMRNPYAVFCLKKNN